MATNSALPQRYQTWSDRSGVIERALRQLLSEGTIQPDVIAAAEIPGMAYQLARLGAIEHISSHSKPANAPATKRQLANLRKRIAALQAAVEELHAPAIELLKLPPTFLVGHDGLTGRLRILDAHAADAVPGALSENAGKGAPQKKRPEMIAKLAAGFFRRLTGRAPTVRTSLDGKASGPFIDLLTTVFDTLNMKASAESQARKIIGMEIKRPKSRT